MRFSSMFRCLILLWVGLMLVAHAASGSSSSRDFRSFLKMPIHRKQEESSSGYGAKWAVLVAGSSGYWNYRHQADVCHAYQILKKGGLKDENIVVFMYDDIATNAENPRPGTIINHPEGSDVYSGVPKDYTGQDVNVDNFLAVILGDKSKVKGGSGKVVSSGPNDHIFIYYSDHGGPGVLGMPLPPYLYASDFISTLKQKHAAKAYKEMVIYIEACESGSILEGLLPESLNIYATTASNAVENSWGTYCPGMNPPPPPEFDTCLGDLYSVAWMEDSEVEDLERETIAQQYGRVKYRTSNHNTYKSGSHVMQYGNITINKEELSSYMGSNPENSRPNSIPINGLSPDVQSMAINQRDADVLYMWQKYAKSKENSLEKFDAQKKLLDTMTHRMHLDKSVELLGNLLFGSERGSAVLKAVRPSGMPLVDDWDCLKKMVRIFEMHCGYLLQYGMKHMRAFANICNADATEDAMARASKEACYHLSSNPWSSLPRGGFTS